MVWDSTVCVPPKMNPSSLKTSSKNLPNRELLSFMVVQALPKASNTGLTCQHKTYVFPKLKMKLMHAWLYEPAQF